MNLRVEQVYFLVAVFIIAHLILLNSDVHPAWLVALWACGVLVVIGAIGTVGIVL